MTPGPKTGARCTEQARLHDHLDGLLEPAESRAFATHLADCAECAREVAAYERLFARLERLPLASPGIDLTEKILARVLPSSARRRWLRTFGWAYAGSLAACVAAVLVATSMPGWSAWVESSSADLSRFAIHAGAFVLNGLAFLVLGVANGWGALLELSGRIAPLPRAFATVLSDPAIALACTAAVGFCVLLLAMLHGRGRRSSGRIDPFGVLGV